jgi:hypothetical protein
MKKQRNQISVDTNTVEVLVNTMHRGIMVYLL